jgi:hypothetical protein
MPPNIPRTVREALIATRGDSEACIGGEGATLVTVGEHLVNLEAYSVEDRQTVLEEFRDGLSAAFAGLWGERTRVVFDFELGE